MNNRVDISFSDHVAHVRLTRPDKLNALDGPMFEQLVAVGEELNEIVDLRAVVLSGEGRAFCAGIDLDGLADTERQSPIDIASREFDGVNMAQHAVMQWRRLPVPVIAAIQDIAFGGGLQLALGADMRFVAPQARMGLIEIKWGLVPDMAGMFLIKGLMRFDQVAELLASGRTFDGDEALRLGLATRVCEDPVDNALTFATQIARSSPDAIRAGKRLSKIAAQYAGREEGLRRILNAEADEQQALICTLNHSEAIRAGLAKRAPRFTAAATKLDPNSNQGAEV